jgi:hypothetical protein
MHNVMAPDSTQAFTKETVEHVCELVLPTSIPDDEDLSPKLLAVDATTCLSSFMEDLGHFARESKEKDHNMVNRAVEVVALLSIRWYAMKQHVSVPEMSDYMKQKWMPPAFSYLVGQILWRHRTADSLRGFTAVVENLHWISLVPGIPGNLIHQVNAVFRVFSGSRSALMKTTQWRKVMELIALNPELRPRVRRCDAVKQVYGDALCQSESGLTRRNFKLMLLKTADLLNVHPIVLFKELASHLEELEAAHKLQKEV